MEMETKYRSLKIGYMETLKRAYPRYSLTIGAVFVTTFTSVCVLCLHIIDSAKKHQLRYMNAAFSDSTGVIRDLDFEVEDLDIYAAENLICQLLDKNPDLVCARKREYLAAYVARMTNSATDVEIAKTWLPYSSLIALQYLFDDLDIQIGPIPKLKHFLGDCLFHYGVKFGLYPYFDEREQYFRAYLLRK